MFTTVTAVALSLPLAAAAPPEKDRVFWDAVKKHQAAVQAIRSVEGTVTVEQDLGETKPTYTGTYRRLGNAVRISEKTPEGMLESLSINGVTLNFTLTHDTVNQASAYRRAGMSPNSWLDVWSCMGLSFPGGLKDRCGLEEFTRQPSAECTAKPVRDDGRDLVHVAVSTTNDMGGAFRFDIYLDPAVNHLVRKTVITAAGRADSRTVWETKQFVEPAKGVFFPVHAEMTGYKDNQVHQNGTYKIADVRVNQPVNVEHFHLPIPAGMRLRDVVNGREYEVDVNGDPVGPVLPYKAPGAIVGARVTTPGKVKDK